MSLAEMFNDDAIDKQLNITVDNTTYTNSEFGSEEMELTESLCSEPALRFGCCEASVFRLRILDTTLPLKGKTMAVSMTLQGEESVQYVIGKYKVDSDKPTADRRYRDIVAYDAMYDILNADVADWYNTILPNADSTVTLKEFRDNFFVHFGIEQEEVALVNDSMIVTKTVEPTKLSGKTVITAICEINGCFGHIGRNGKFQYIFLKEMVEGLYPADTLYPRDDLYPADPINSHRISGSHYTSAKYEDFRTERINKLQIRQEEDDVGCIYGTGDNCYIVQDNFLVYGKSSEELQTIATNLYSVISKVWYRPAHVEAKGNPCLEVGDGIRLRTTREIIYTYILQRTLKGIQALRDTYDAEGEQYQTEDVNSVHESIIQLKGKANKLTRTVEETRLEISDIEKGLSSRITQNAENITAEVERAIGQEVELAAAIKINADNISLKVSRDNVISEINQTAEKITIKAEKIDLKGLVEADEFISKYATVVKLDAANAAIDEVNARVVDAEDLIAQRATIEQLNTTNANVGKISASVANLETAVIGKLDVTEFNADTISAMNIKVRAADVTGTLTADKIDAGSLKIGASQITGTTEVSVVYSYGTSTIHYKDYLGNDASMDVITQLNLKRIKVLEAY